MIHEIAPFDHYTVTVHVYAYREPAPFGTEEVADLVWNAVEGINIGHPNVFDVAMDDNPDSACRKED